MLKYGDPRGPQPYVVDLETGEKSAVATGEGMWALPCWR
jgi:hypothetical protein